MGSGEPGAVVIGNVDGVLKATSTSVLPKEEDELLELLEVVGGVGACGDDDLPLPQPLVVSRRTASSDVNRWEAARVEILNPDINSPVWWYERSWAACLLSIVKMISVRFIAANLIRRVPQFDSYYPYPRR
jgi:hypothetical protein